MLNGYPKKPWAGKHTIMKPSFRNGSKLSAGEGNLVGGSFVAAIVMVPILLVLSFWFPAFAAPCLIGIVLWTTFLNLMIKGTKTYSKEDARKLISIENAYNKMPLTTQKEYRKYLQAAYDDDVDRNKTLELFRKNEYVPPAKDTSVLNAEIDGLLKGHQELDKINGSFNA
jgi:hypothetical protein